MHCKRDWKPPAITSIVFAWSAQGMNGRPKPWDSAYQTRQSICKQEVGAALPRSSEQHRKELVATLTEVGGPDTKNNGLSDACSVIGGPPLAVPVADGTEVAG